MTDSSKEPVVLIDGLDFVLIDGLGAESLLFHPTAPPLCLQGPPLPGPSCVAPDAASVLDRIPNLAPIMPNGWRCPRCGTGYSAKYIASEHYADRFAAWAAAARK